jgi:predicted metal-binding membrane protein
LIGLLVTAAALAWAVTDDRMQGMDAGPGTELGGLAWFTGVWVVMMAAMMFPAIWPMVVMFTRVQTRKQEEAGRWPGATILFVAGYLVAWSAVGIVAYAIFEIFRSADIGFMAWDEGGRYLAAGVILGAAVYQLTPLKDVCLRKCRNPLMFLMHSWRPGRTGALRMGIEHGAWCVGCCWALMAALFALGVMSIGWMALIAAFIALEKLLPWKTVATGIVTVVLVALAIGVLAEPTEVPGLTVPGSPEANQAMESMGMEAEPSGSDAMPGMEADQPPATDEMEGSGGMMDEKKSKPGAMGEMEP